MLLLAIDTAGPNCAVALAHWDGRRLEPVYRMEERIGRGHAERLIPMIGAALGSAGLGYGDLDRIAVCIGPGSFTGVRVGVAAARGLAMALGIAAVGVGSLSALAWDAADKSSEGAVVATLDAKRGEIYALAQDAATGALSVQPFAATAEHAAERLGGLPEPLSVTGSGAPLLAPFLAGRRFDIIGASDTPDILHVARLAARSEPGSPPVPLYLRGADAKPQLGKAVARR